ncbi:hypothetical protein PF011_g21823 [Phytophthora fragariae]|uniref:Uncharacterized protein n=1 Tax=Phytophthora fragariae TaxID=53985 RepID=A0A6A3IQZ6_9STRA|nr:hypothetical protein PF011_g21823 [Phytophthora fragariae]
MRLVLRVSTTIYRSRSWWRATRNSKRTGRVYAGGKRVDHTLDYTYKEEGNYGPLESDYQQEQQGHVK